MINVVFTKIKTLILNFLYTHKLFITKQEKLVLDQSISILTKEREQLLFQTPKKRNTQLYQDSISLAKSEYITSQEMFENIKESPIFNGESQRLTHLTDQEIKQQFGKAVILILNKGTQLNIDVSEINPYIFQLVKAFLI